MKPKTKAQRRWFSRLLVMGPRQVTATVGEAFRYWRDPVTRVEYFATSETSSVRTLDEPWETIHRSAKAAWDHLATQTSLMSRISAGESARCIAVAQVLAAQPDTTEIEESL